MLHFVTPEAKSSHRAKHKTKVTHTRHKQSMANMKLLYCIQDTQQRQHHTKLWHRNKKKKKNTYIQHAYILYCLQRDLRYFFVESFSSYLLQAIYAHFIYATLICLDFLIARWQQRRQKQNCDNVLHINSSIQSYQNHESLFFRPCA